MSEPLFASGLIWIIEVSSSHFSIVQNRITSLVRLFSFYIKQRNTPLAPIPEQECFAIPAQWTSIEVMKNWYETYGRAFACLFAKASYLIACRS